jgi:outer membrane receptor protein involved in Fe transport
VFALSAYAIQSRLDLFSDFTYNLDHPSPPSPLDADQFEQAEHRRVFGLAASRSFDTQLAGHDSTNTIGLQLRHDRLDPVGLYGSVARQRVSITQESRVSETSMGLYAENSTHWAPRFRSVIGLRVDRFLFDVQSSIAQNSGKQDAGMASPKLALIFGPWRKTEYFVDLGTGYHSNDARGVTATLAPKELSSITASPALVRSKGAELGLRTDIIPGLQTSVALWQLKLGSELVFSGDAADTQASGASTRRGIEVNSHYRATPWLLLDADIAVSRARFDEDQGEAPHAGRSIPGAVDRVASFGATVSERGPWFEQFQLRYFGPRPLIEDDSQRSRATTLANLRAGYRLAPNLQTALDVFNLFDRKASDIDYYYASRLPGEAAGGVADTHFHPVEPRSIRLTMTANF